MSTQIFSTKDAYHFIKVEQYFDRYKEWDQLGSVVSHNFDPQTENLALNFKKQDGNLCSMLIQFPQKDTFRMRFNPGKTADQFTTQNTRSVIQDNFKDLKRLLEIREEFTIEAQENNSSIQLITKGSDNKPCMRMLVNFAPFSITVFNALQDQEFQVWKTAETPIYFTANGYDDYAIIQAVAKPATARYVGFGEQGGQSLDKNTQQINYFNFDNMRYRQVYNQGPLDNREPLYHSEPVFFEYNGVPDRDSVNALFIDNPGQLLIDIGYQNSGRYMFGTRFGDLDYYFFMGNDTATVIDSFTSIVGRSRLKPRYVLGFHQGCYGYERRDILEWAVNKYREYQIPIDGMHVDVDIQHNYQTFTIDTGKFPNPQEMFGNLKAQGIKCSTNITPVISNQDTQNYTTYTQARDQQLFVKDNRYLPDDPDSKRYQLYGGGNEYCPNENKTVDGFNSGQPYIGEVYYGQDANKNDLGTTGHYADLGRSEVRDWWGTQYQYLFDMGLEMVWQDMTTPAIRENRGDMKGFPFRLEISSDFLSETKSELTPAIKVWNLYSYNLHKATYHGLNKLKGRENKRNFIIGRGSFTGSHRYAGLWTGDNSSDWDFLKMNVSQALSLGMCGVVINGQDIGGFETSMDGGSWASPELLIRWTAAGAFLPWFRNHYVRKGRKEFQEPFMYVEWFNQYKGGQLPEPQNLYRMVLPICKHYIELRYRLIQVFYDALFENTINGLPISRPLFINAPSDKSLFNDKEQFLDNEFFVGKDLLIAPVLNPQTQNGFDNLGKRDVYLPTGNNWYCFMNNSMPLGSVVEGGTTIRDFDANLNTTDNHINFIVPIYVREGAIIPTVELEQYVGQLNEQGKPNPVTLNIYPGQCGSYNMYLDDGVSRSSASVDAHPVDFGGSEDAKGEYRQTNILHQYTSPKTREITIERIHDNYTPPLETYFFVAILHDPAEQKGGNGPLVNIKINDTDIALITGSSPDQKANGLLYATVNAWYYNETINISFIKVLDNASKITLTATYN